MLRQMAVEVDRSLHVVPASPNQGRPSVEAVLPGADLTTLESGGPCTYSSRFTAAKAIKAAAATAAHPAQRETRQEISSTRHKAYDSGAECADEETRANLGFTSTGRHNLPAIHGYFFFHPYCLPL